MTRTYRATGWSWWSDHHDHQMSTPTHPHPLEHPLSIWTSIPPTTTPDPLDSIPARNWSGMRYGDITRSIGVEASTMSTVCRLFIDEDDVVLSADEVAELIARLQAALVLMVA